MRLFHRVRKVSGTLANVMRRGAPHPVADFNDEDLERAAFLSAYPVATVIDVGAHVGEFARAVHKALPEADIYSFEPQEACLPYLKSLPRTKVFHTAVGEEDGTVRFEQNAFTACSSILPLTHEARSAFPYTGLRKTSIEVPIHRLDTLLDVSQLKREILLKVDVQGFEDRVLRGAPRLLAETSWILIEVSYQELYKGQMLAPELRQLVENAGFRYVRTTREMPHTFSGEVMQADFFFERT